MKIILSALIGGFLMFCWGAVSHMVLQVGDPGIKQIANEAEVTAALKANIPQAGFYAIPGMDMTRDVSEAEQAAWAAKYEAGPNAIIIYHPEGQDVMSPRQLGIEFASNAGAALMLALTLAFAGVTFGRGLLISLIFGLGAWLSIVVSYWNWYRFPADFAVSELIDQVVGFLIAGVAVAFFMRRKA